MGLTQSDPAAPISFSSAGGIRRPCRLAAAEKSGRRLRFQDPRGASSRRVRVSGAGWRRTAKRRGFQKNPKYFVITRWTFLAYCGNV